MKTVFILAACSAMLFLAGCHDEPDIVKPGSQDPPAHFAFKIEIPEGFIPNTDGVKAIVSITNGNDIALLTDHPLTLTVENGYLVTEDIDLPAGNYKLTKLFVTKDNQVLLATPLLNSPKASEIQPLPLAFENSTPVVVEALLLEEHDLPEDLGYAEMAFGERPYIKVKVKSVVHVAGVNYTPAANVQITSGTFTRQVQNGNEILLPKKFATYHFLAEHWGVSSQKTFSTAELTADPSVMLENSSVLRRLKTEEVSVMLPEGSVITSRTEYSYSQDWQVEETRNYQQRVDSDELALQTISRYEYANGQLTQINRFNGEDVNIGYTSFEYDGKGRITAIEEDSYRNHTSAVFSYEETSPETIHAVYAFDNGKTMTYVMKYEEMNKVEDAAFGTGSETGKYSYDDRINPFYFLNLHNLFLSNTSKNNRITEEKNYGGNIPSLELYETEYVYNGQGYPDLVFKSYRGFLSKDHVLKNMIEYSYYD